MGGVDRVKALALASLIGAFAATSFSNSFFEIFSGLFLGLSLLGVLYQRRWDIFKNRLALAAAVYLLVVLFSVIPSEYLSNSLRGAFRVLRSLLMVLLTVWVVDDGRKFKTVFFCLLGVAFVVGLDACLQGFFGFDLIRREGLTVFRTGWGRVTGPFHHANDFSAYLSLVLFFFIGMLPHVFRRMNGKARWFYGGGSVLLLVCLLWTYARGAWLAVLATLFLMVLLRKSRNMFLLLVLGVALVLALSPAMLKVRFASLADLKDGTLTERRLLWEESLEMIRQRPWLGFGVNTYSKVEPYFKSNKVYTDNQYAHNGYLQMAAETGLLGLGSFLLLLSVFFSETARVLPKSKDAFLKSAALSVLLGIVSFLIHSATDTDLQSLRLVSAFWLSMGLTWAAVRILESSGS